MNPQAPAIARQAAPVTRFNLALAGASVFSLTNHNHRGN